MYELQRLKPRKRQETEMPSIVKSVCGKIKEQKYLWDQHMEVFPDIP